MHPIQPNKNQCLGPSGVQRERFNQPAEFFPCIFSSLKLRHTYTLAHSSPPLPPLSVSTSHTAPSTHCQHFLLFDLCFYIASGPTAKRLKPHIKVLSAPSNLCSHRDVGFTSTSRVLGRFRVKRLKVRTRGQGQEVRGGGGMLFTMDDNKELLCIVASSLLLTGSWNHCTKQHIVKLGQNSCASLRNWLLSLCDITKGSFLLHTLSQVLVLAL